MNVSAHVDVIMAAAPEDAALVASAALKHEGSPNPQRRVIVLAPTRALGGEHAKGLGIEPIVIVTPRSPHGARGLTADDISEAPGLTPEELAELMTEVLPSLATTRTANA